MIEHEGLDPNVTLLEHALRQTGHSEIVAVHWREALREQTAALDWDSRAPGRAPGTRVYLINS